MDLMLLGLVVRGPDPGSGEVYSIQAHLYSAFRSPPCRGNPCCIAFPVWGLSDRNAEGFAGGTWPIPSAGQGCTRFFGRQRELSKAISRFAAADTILDQLVTYGNHRRPPSWLPSQNSVLRVRVFYVSPLLALHRSCLILLVLA